jgi:hypothetical protein
MLVPITDNGPAFETESLKVTSPEVVVKVKCLPDPVPATALLMVTAPVLLRVAEPVPSWEWIAAGVTFEVPDELVYQTPLSHSPLESRAPEETVMAAGIRLVVTSLEDVDQAPVTPLTIGATWKM